MACRYYDDLLVAKIQKWIPEDSNLRVLKPDETKRLFNLTADDNADQAFKMPFIALSRSNDVELLLNTKNSKSFDGLTLNPANISPDLSKLHGEEYRQAVKNIPDLTAKLNVIPIKLNYQLDIYTKKYEECDEYVRNFVFKLINNPLMIIEIPYNGINLRHTANIRVLPTISDSSDISERIFSGQFTRYTIQLEIQDAFLFSIPYRNNWRLIEVGLETSKNINVSGEYEQVWSKTDTIKDTKQ